MVQWWKSLRLQARFMALTGIGVLILAACALALVSWFEVSSLKQRFRSAAENELKSLAALVESAMEQRLNDQENVAIKVFNGWFESRNKEYSGKLWSVWSPKVTAYMAQTDRERAAKKPLDGIDREALRTGLPWSGSRAAHTATACPSCLAATPARRSKFAPAATRAEWA